MHIDPRDAYLETQVSTATPQKLRLMLIEGAIRFARQGQQAWLENRPDDAFEHVARCRAIVAELLAGVRVEESSLTRQVAALYGFLFRVLTDAQTHRDPVRLEEVVRVLDEERLTWAAVCEQMPELPAGTDRHVPEEILAPRSGGIPSEAFMSGVAPAASVSPGFSIDA
jgi:flagellar secretion chaperone FliS